MTKKAWMPDQVRHDDNNVSSQLATIIAMYTVIEVEEFSRWLSGLKDRSTRIRLARRLNKARRGILGDIKPVGEGVTEMREFFGSGWRMYYVERAGALIIMLGGGDKSSQTGDIERAKKLAKELP